MGSVLVNDMNGNFLTDAINQFVARHAQCCSHILITNFNLLLEASVEGVQNKQRKTNSIAINFHNL